MRKDWYKRQWDRESPSVLREIEREIERIYNTSPLREFHPRHNQFGINLLKQMLMEKWGDSDE
jgi:hypothetical protein